jgi:protein SCO1/2
MMSYFAELEKKLRDEPALYEKTHLLTISFDPEHDSPPVLADYADKQVPGHDGSFDHWELATGKPQEIEEITKFFGLTYRADEDQIVHSLRTAVIAPDGTLVEVYRGNNWKPAEILTDLKGIALP